jgi:hypothetical protein
MNLITFGFNEKGTPIFLNQEPYPQVGTLYLMKAGKNSVIGITLDDKAIKLAKAPAKALRGRKPKAEVAETAPKKRGRKPKAEATVAAPKKRVKKPGRPKAKKEKPVKKEKSEKKVEVAV